eukprot:4097992-Lingulodinium_polyedra.AAC.1
MLQPRARRPSFGERDDRVPPLGHGEPGYGVGRVEQIVARPRLADPDLLRAGVPDEAKLRPARVAR